MRVGITYNLRSDVEASHPAPLVEDMYEEFDSPETIDAIGRVLKALGHDPVPLGFGPEVAEKIITEKIEMVFNIAEGYSGRAREAHIPALLEMLNIPYTGPNPMTAALTLDKIAAKKMALACGVATPDCAVVGEPGEVKFPAIIKLAYEGSSKGIRQSSKVFNAAELERQAAWLKTNYPEQPILAEEFVPGREFTVGVIGNETPEILGVMEVVPRGRALEDFVYSLEVKRDYLAQVDYFCPPEIDEELKKRLEEAALRLYRIFECRDISRFDFRVDAKGDPYFLEVNTLPGLHPVSSDIVIMARLRGIAYEELIKRIFELAAARYKLNYAYV